MSAAELISRGGPLLYVILSASVVALAVFIERRWSLRRAVVAPRALIGRVRALVAAGELAEARHLCAGSHTRLGRILDAGLAQAGQARAEIKERMEEVGRREAAHMGRFVGALGVVASVTPLLGLLGTVTGMIGVFQEVVREGVGDPATLAGGIWEALITTAAGLAVAIPAYLAWRYLVARVGDLLLEAEEEAATLLDLICGSGAPPAPELPAPELPAAGEEAA